MAESTKAGSKGSANFMRQFRDKKTRELKNLTASQFMDVWSHYDKDGQYSMLCIPGAPRGRRAQEVPRPGHAGTAWPPSARAVHQRPTTAQRH
ncbi:hypothetical protein HPB48_003613 [Haemaphysalis longicornis]|uniref:Calbindin-32 n=1 Tax=Haemaphysalis longicornis TaxID=44386 RepID=A0A9J6FFW7_HAELO|nr:hypothetical protein HPB48_003613 [Haemaphysalis longicornis]